MSLRVPLLFVIPRRSRGICFCRCFCLCFCLFYRVILSEGSCGPIARAAVEGSRRAPPNQYISDLFNPLCQTANKHHAPASSERSEEPRMALAVACSPKHTATARVPHLRAIAEVGMYAAKLTASAFAVASRRLPLPLSRPRLQPWHLGPKTNWGFSPWGMHCAMLRRSRLCPTKPTHWSLKMRRHLKPATHNDQLK